MPQGGGKVDIEMRKFDRELWQKIGLFAGGVLFGTAGLSILGSKDAKKAYTHATAAVLRAKERVMKQATTIKENADDILADAQDINEQRAEAEAAAVVADAVKEAADSADAVKAAQE